jgi:hypothetical protein
MLLSALLASSQMVVRNVAAWQSLGEKPSIRSLTARHDRLACCHRRFASKFQSRSRRDLLKPYVRHTWLKDIFQIINNGPFFTKSSDAFSAHITKLVMSNGENDSIIRIHCRLLN